MKTLRHFLMIFLASWAFVLLPAQAMADDAQLSCNGTTPVGELYNTGENNDGGACAYTGIKHVFSQVVCSVVVVINEVMDNIYCGMQSALTNLLAVITTVYIAIFGVQILMGHTQLSPKEIIIRLLKIAGVWTFVSQSSWGIGIIFNFFYSFFGKAVYWAYTAVQNAGVTADGTPIVGPTDQGNVMPIYSYMDDLVYQAITGPFFSANSELIGFFAAMGLLMPPLWMMAVYWLWMSFSLMVRALITFLLAISAIAFLIALSPIFLSCMLFAVTRQFFENWLRYMMSYSLQIVIVFACIAMWLIAITYFVGFFGELSAVIFDSKKLPGVATTLSASDSYGICPYYISTDAQNVPHIYCQNPDFNPVIRPTTDGKAMIFLADIAQKKNELLSQTQTGLNQLIYFIVYHLLTLLIVSYAFDALLKNASLIAIQLGGPQYVPMLGKGFGSVGFGSIKGVAPVLRNPLAAHTGNQSRVTAGENNVAGGLVQQWRNQIGKR